MFQFNLIPTEIKKAKEDLKQQELENFAQADINYLIARRTSFYDQLLIQLWKHFKLDKTELSLVAVGGYGRQEMFPLSDLDFLILAEQKIALELEKNISDFIQFLWDCGFDVGSAVRTLSESETEARADISIATNLFESRFLCGNQKTFQKLTALLDKTDFWHQQDFFQAKLVEKEQRYARYNNTSYNLEPDIKYSPGGLRDLHFIYWIALRQYNARNLEQILNAGFIYSQEYEQLKASQQFLFRVRFALHLVLKRYDNRLLFDRQLKVAELLGYQGEGNQDVEHLMKHFFQALNQISCLSEILTKHYVENVLQSAVENERVLLDEDFALQNNKILLIQSDIFTHQPEKILDLFYYLTCYPVAEIASFTLRQLYIALGQQRSYLSANPLAREKFVRLFNQPQAISRALALMHKYGVLAAYIPQWKNIEGLMQFDLFHIYTVDEHSLRVMLNLEDFLSVQATEQYPICHRIFTSISDRSLIYITALFHDIAKGRGGDHALLGADDIRHFAQQHGFDRREVETMSWLVEQHLLMSTVAQRRDIHDPKVVRDFAEITQNKVRLDLLTCLTVADICATNQTLWNSWKSSLFTSLYQYSLQQFAQGTGCLLNIQEKINRHRQQALNILQIRKPLISIEQLEQLWNRCSEDYFLRNSEQELALQAELLLDLNQDILVKVSNRFSNAGTRVFIYCKDQPNLFYKVVSCIGAKKFSIHDARISTTADGYAMDSFIITELNGGLVKFDRRRTLESSLISVITSVKLPKNTYLTNSKLAHFQIETEVRFLNISKQEQTEFELLALDKAGLLAKVSQVFMQLGLNLINAKITTVGAKVEDFFIVANKQNKALNEIERQQLELLLKSELG